MKRTLLLTALAALAASGIALATPGSGIVSAPVLARATFPDQFKLKLRDSSHAGDTVAQMSVRWYVRANEPA